MTEQKPILRDFPDFIETERLLIRAPRPGDGTVVNKATRETIAELQPWMPWAQTEPTPEESEMYVRQGAADWLTRKNLPLLIFRRSDGLFLGGTGFHRIDWSIPRVEIGYWLRTSETGKGYMTEAVEGLTRFAFETLGAVRIEIRCDARNVASAAVAKRAGYTLEGTFRYDGRGADGSLRDTLIFACVRESPE